MVSARQAPKPVAPPKGQFFFAGRLFPRIAWWKHKEMRRLYFYTLVLIITNTANGFDGSMMNGLQTLSYWRDYFDNPRGSILGLFNASMSLGSLIGLFPVPYLIDAYGRKAGIILGCCIMLLAVGLQAGAQNFGMFIAARLLLGFGDTIVLGAAPLLIAEISHPQDRAVMVTLSASSYFWGAFIASWVTYGTLRIQSEWAWRLPSLLQGICSLVILCVIWFTPESPRWLINKDRADEAFRILVKYHSDGNPRDEFVLLEFSEISTAISLDKQLNKNSWVDLLRTKGNRKRISIITAIAFFSQWSGNGLISYYLYQVMNNIGITNANTQLGINAGLKSWDLVLNLVFSLFIDKLGRRPIYLTSTIGTFFAFTTWTIISARYAIHPAAGLGYGFVVMIFVYGFFYDVKSGLLAAYTTEILPYGLRAKGYTWLNFCVSASLFFNQYVNAVALDAIAWKYYLVYVVFLGFEIVVIYFFIVETRYTPLEEVGKFFDGDEAADVADLANTNVEEMKAMGKAGVVAQEIEVA
ncbi:hypothetical protein CLAIMM_06681 [Cladophialophora immunda]|nr:hypothetical protein CLAIMM_06681 [Cladophialophora immunda]